MARGTSLMVTGTLDLQRKQIRPLYAIVACCRHLRLLRSS